MLQGTLHANTTNSRARMFGRVPCRPPYSTLSLFLSGSIFAGRRSDAETSRWFCSPSNWLKLRPSVLVLFLRLDPCRGAGPPEHGVVPDQLLSFISFFIFVLLWGNQPEESVPTKCSIVFLYHILCRYVFISYIENHCKSIHWILAVLFIPSFFILPHYIFLQNISQTYGDNLSSV